MKSIIFSLASASALKVGVFSDLHMKLDYDPTTSKKSCGPANSMLGADAIEHERFLSKPAASDPLALLGRLGCDAPKPLVDMMLQLFAIENSDADFITLNGDLVAHGVAQTPMAAGITQDLDPLQTLKDTHK